MEAKEFRRLARENLAGDWGNAILAAFLAALLGGLIVSGGNVDLNIKISENQLQLLPSMLQTLALSLLSVGGTLSLIHFILGGVIRQGYAIYLLKQYDRKSVPQVNDLFSQFDHFGDAFCLKFLQGLFIFLWSLLLVFPGIMKSYAYSMAPFIMAENPEMTAREALRASDDLMYGHKAELFFLDLSFIGWVLLSVLTLGIGSFWLNPYMNAAHAAFYRNLSYVTVE